MILQCTLWSWSCRSGVVLFLSCDAGRHNDLEGHSNFSCTIYCFSIPVEHGLGKYYVGPYYSYQYRSDVVLYTSLMSMSMSTVDFYSASPHPPLMLLLWRSTVALIYLKVKSAKCLCLLPMVLVLVLVL